MDRLLVAFRYILGRPISLISLFGVIVGVGSIVVVDSVMNGFLREQMMMIRGTMPDLSVRLPKEFSRDPEGVQQAVDQIAAADGVKSAALRLSWPAMYSNSRLNRLTRGSRASKYLFVQVIGLDLPNEGSWEENDERFGLARRPWQNPKLGDQRVAHEDPFWFDAQHPYWQERVDPSYALLPLKPILFSRSLAFQMGLSVGQVFQLATFGVNDEGGFPKRRLYFVLTGTFRTQDESFDLTHTLTRRSDLREFVGLQEEGREIAVQAAAGVKEELLQENLRAALATTTPLAPEHILTWADQKRMLLRAIENERGIMNFVLFFLVLVAAFNLFVTLSMMVSEKVREVGVMVSMGSSPGRVASIFLLWGLLITTVGAILGLGGGLALTWNINEVHDAISAVTGWHLFDPKIYAFSSIPTDVDAKRITFFVIATFVLTTVFTLFPSLHAGRLQVVEALRRE